MMLSKLLQATFAVWLLHIQPISGITQQINEPDPLASCEHYMSPDGTPYPLNICTSQSIQGVITSTQTTCDSESQSVIHQTFTGPDCSPPNIQSEETLDREQVYEVTCNGDNCAVSYRTYANDDCASDFTDFAFIRGTPYIEPTQCIIYDCSLNERADGDGIENIEIGIATVDCATYMPYMMGTYREHALNCHIYPLSCGLYSSEPPATTDPISILLPPATKQTDTPTTTTTAAPLPFNQSRQLLPKGEMDPDVSVTGTTSIGATYLSHDNDAQNVHDEHDAFEPVSTFRIYALPAIPMASICFTIVLIILLSLIYFMYFDEDGKSQMTSALKLFVIASIGCNLFGIVCIMIVTVMMQMMIWNEDTYQMALLPYYGSCIGYVGGKFCLESFFLLRVYTSFQGSVFAMSKRKCVLLFIWMSSISLLWFITFIMDDDRMYFGYVLIWAFECVFIITLLCVFGSGLQRLLAQTVKSSLQRIKAPQPAGPAPSNSVITTDTRDSPSPDRSNTLSVPSSTSSSRVSCTVSVESVPDVSALQFISTPSVRGWRYVCCKMREHVRSTKSSISSERLSLIHLMTRCVLLSSVSLITTAVFGIFLSMQTSIDIQSIYILYTIWCIDIAINSCCLFLNFRFTNVFYQKCCSLCHRSCQNMLEYMSASHIVHNDAKAFSLERARSTSE
eukprot:146746_1